MKVGKRKKREREDRKENEGLRVETLKEGMVEVLGSSSFGRLRKS